MDWTVLLSPLLGGIGRLASAWMDYRNKKLDYEQELKMQEMQMKLDEQRAKLHLQEVAAIAEANVEESWATALSAALESEGQRTGDKFIDRLSASVRPVLTYWWCMVLYSAYKIVLAIVAYRAGAGLSEFARIIVTEFDATVIGSIFGFWFVDRALRGKLVR